MKFSGNQLTSVIGKPQLTFKIFNQYIDHLGVSKYTSDFLKTETDTGGFLSNLLKTCILPETVLRFSVTYLKHILFPKVIWVTIATGFKG